MADLSSYALKSEDSPFQLFLNDINGLRSFQPTLLWKIDFTRYSKDFPNNQKVIFTDSITVPGEKISTSVAETFVGDLPYPINDRRSTTNTLSIGFFVDIYGTLEKRIVDDIKFIAKHGIKEGIKQQINLYGYRMGSNDYNPRKPEFTRPCYIHYSFEKCVPVSMDEFTYDHKNDKWGRTRNVTFAFTEYRIETDGQSLSENTKKLNDVEFGRVVNGVPDVISGLKERKTSDGSIVWKGVRTSNQLGFDKKKKDFTKSDFYVDTDTKAHKDKIDFNAFIRELYEASERASNGNVLTYVPNSETDIPVGTGTSAPVAGGTNRNGYVYLYKHPGYKWADVIDPDHPKYGQYRRESLLTSIVKTAVKKFLMPDTPIYNGTMAPVSKAIRKVEQWFYTEPKHKTTPEDDHTLINTHTKSGQISVDPDDTPHPTIYDNKNLVEIPYYDHIVNHGPADTIKIDQHDFTYQNHHGTPNEVPIDPNDYTKQMEHNQGTLVPIDPNDYTKQNAHGDPNNVKIDPNDYTMIGSHDKGNLVPVDPNDHTKQTTHNDGNLVPVDPNDHTKQTTHNDGNLIPVDPDDRPTHTTVTGKQIPIDQNDYVKSASLSPDIVPADPNDHIVDQTTIKVNTKAIDPNDYAVGAEAQANNVPINPNDYAVSSEIKADMVKIDQNDHIVDSSNIEYRNAKIPENDYAKAEDVLKGDAKLVPITQNDNTGLFSHKEANIIPVGQNDAVVDHKKTENLVPANPNDNIMDHRNNGKMVSIDQKDTPDASTIKAKHVHIEQSFIDFARLIINEKKSGGDSITSHGKIDEIRKIDDDRLISHIETPTNLIKLPDEPQSIRSGKRNKGHLVDVHEADHTELDKYERK